MRLTDAQRIFSDQGMISVISFKVDDMYKAAGVGREIEDTANQGQRGAFETTNWMEQNRELFRALRLEQYVTFIVLALILFVAALNILIALTMMVMEKTRDIAVLMSFGVTAQQVRRIFLLQGLLISVIGTALGLVIGYGVSWTGGHYRFIHLDAAVYSIDYLPFAPRVVDALIVGAVSLGVSLVATIYPSGSAAKVLPAEALRYE
jgi:lipoprotein-releasing system permease protein